MLCCDKPDAGPELDLARRGLALYGEIEELLGAEAGIRRKGALLVHTGEAVPDAEAGPPGADARGRRGVRGARSARRRGRPSPS